MSSSGGSRQEATRQLLERVARSEECWAYNIQTVLFLVTNSGVVSEREAQGLLRACSRDVLDLGPADQRVLTELVWESLSTPGLVHTGARPGHLHSAMLRAHTFQGITVDLLTLRTRLEEEDQVVEHDLKVAMLEHLCHTGRVQEAWSLQEEGRGMVLSEALAASLVLGHCLLGQVGGCFCYSCISCSCSSSR